MKSIVYPALDISGPASVVPGSAIQVPPPTQVKYSKRTIPKAVKEQVWLRHIGPNFSSKCKTPWCKNKISVFDYHTCHIIPESSGGPMTLDNLIPLCFKCNLSMGTMTFNEWTSLVATRKKKKWWRWRWFVCGSSGSGSG